MNSTLVKNIFRFIGLVLFQVLILDQLNLHGFINPYIYPLFLLLLPLQIAPWALMLLGFTLGISVDLFTNSMGLHAAASVFMAFLRPYVLTLVIPSGGYEAEDSPTIRSLGLGWFFSYAFVLILLHHLAYFYLEVFRFSGFFTTFLKVILSSFFSIFLIIVAQYLSSPKK